MACASLSCTYVNTNRFSSYVDDKATFPPPESDLVTERIKDINQLGICI